MTFEDTFGEKNLKIIKKIKIIIIFPFSMNTLLLRATRQRAQSRLYEASCLAHRLITVNEQALIYAIADERETLEGLADLTDNLEKLLQNPTELLVQFPFLSPKRSPAPLTSDDSKNLPGEDDAIYEFMSLYDSEDVVDYRNMKDAADTILDELAAANAFPNEEVPQAKDVYEPKVDLPLIETEFEITTEHNERNDATTDLLMKGFLVSADTNVTKRKNKSPRNGDGSRTSPGKSDGEKKRGRPPVSPCDKKPKVKKPKAAKKGVNELSDCDEELDNR